MNAITEALIWNLRTEMNLHRCRIADLATSMRQRGCARAVVAEAISAEYEDFLRDFDAQLGRITRD